MNTSIDQYKKEISIPWAAMGMKNATEIMNDVFLFAAAEQLGMAVTNSIIKHVLYAVKNNTTGAIQSLDNINAMVGGIHYKFTGNINGKKIELKKTKIL
jgi:hypothetical protein